MIRPSLSSALFLAVSVVGCDCDPCGDGDIDPGELCDDGNRVNDDECSNDCRVGGGHGYYSPCGDGITHGTEECDDHNVEDGDGCDSDCTWTCEVATECGTAAHCGAPQCIAGGTYASRCVVVDAEDGTHCEGGAGTAVCRRAACCGDHTPDLDEQCDDGNNVGGDGCEPDCTVTRPCVDDGACSDGQACNGSEVCLDPDTAVSRCVPGASLVDGTACEGTKICLAGSCVAPRCGDGIQSAGEDCEGEDPPVTEPCPYGVTSCTICDDHCHLVAGRTSYCGDQTYDPENEACDDHNTVTETACPYGTPSCTACDATCDTALSLAGAYCGDGTRNIASGEDCDEQNTSNSDDCLTNCRAATCGDGFLRVDAAQPSDVEECDGGPGCTSDCTTTTGSYAECGVTFTGNVMRCSSTTGASCPIPAQNECECNFIGGVAPALCQTHMPAHCVCECSRPGTGPGTGTCWGPGMDP